VHNRLGVNVDIGWELGGKIPGINISIGTLKDEFGFPTDCYVPTGPHPTSSSGC